MTDPWQIRVRRFHSATRADVHRPYRTRFRRRLKYMRLTMYTTTSGRDHEARAIEAALERVPASVPYEVVDA